MRVKASYPAPTYVIVVEFRRIMTGDKTDDELVEKVGMTQVPLPGEVVNISGEPYIVRERAWKVTQADLTAHAYVRVAHLHGKAK